MGDINEYILSHNIRRFMVNLGLTEMITNKHGGQGPGTTISNNKGQEIDGIWALTRHYNFSGRIPTLPKPP